MVQTEHGKRASWGGGFSHSHSGDSTHRSGSPDSCDNEWGSLGSIGFGLGEGDRIAEEVEVAVDGPGDGEATDAGGATSLPSAVASTDIGGGAVQQEEEKTMSDEWQTHLDPATNKSYHLNSVTPVESAATATAARATEGQRRASHRHERRMSKQITPVCAGKKRIDWSPSSVNSPSSAALDLRRGEAGVPGAATEGIVGEEHPAPRDATKLGQQQPQLPQPPQPPQPLQRLRVGRMVQHQSSTVHYQEDDFL